MWQIKGNGDRSVKENRKWIGKLLAVVLCLAAGAVPLEALAEDAVSQSAEGEITADNEREGVRTGSVDGIVEGSVTWTYDPATKETVVTGSGRREANTAIAFVSPFLEETEHIRFENCVLSGSYWGLFAHLSDLETINFSGLVADNVTNMGGMFAYCSSLTSLDMSGFDTGNVTDMRNMFQHCVKLGSLDVSGLDTENVTNMSYMFSACDCLNSLDVSGFNTENVESMGGMFNGCSGLSSLDVSGFDTGNARNMSYMFNDCSGLSSLDVSGLDTGNVNAMSQMFAGCSSLSSLDMSGLDTKNVKHMYSMFNGCSGLSSLDVSGLGTGNVTDMDSMFSGCSGLSSLDVSGFDMEKVRYGRGIFSGCIGLKILNAPKNLGEREIDLPGTFVDQEGNRTDVLDVNYSGKLLTREATVSESGYVVSGTVQLSGDTTATVELIDAQGTVAATQTVTSSTAEYRLENVPAGTYTLRVSQANGVVREYAVAVTDTDVSQDTEVQLLGDVNGDGTINARDKRMLFNHIENISELTGYLFEVGDVNGDGTINARDKKMLYNHIERIAALWQEN